MKKRTLFFIAGLTACLLVTLAGCGGGASESRTDDNTVGGGYTGESSSLAESAPSAGAANASKLVNIKEKMFVAQINDIYLNPDDYIGKTIQYEGMFTTYTWDEMNMTYHMVYRASPGCCGTDGVAGFEVVWPEGSDKTLPKENDWCEVVGTLERYKENGESYLQIVMDTLTVKTERGAEFVAQ
ncbi:MAG: hypothetical protein LBC58_01295 [Clostridiales Family XIII bacterium]|jgi:uncharacterized membrane protein YcgQ (UPF0703/DUF1980 family)|nr:hypothetical protein [Clostridiales Family XIII bacterium]